jgi:hypothetical protein
MNCTNPSKVCLHCGDQLPPRSRADRKFCPVKFGIWNHCKNSYHNPKALADYHENKGIVAINKRNRDILKLLLGDWETALVNERTLLSMGFKMAYMINKARMEQSQNMVALFLEFGLEYLGNQQYKLFRHGKKF